MVVIKADVYGRSVVMVAIVMQECDVRLFDISNIRQAIELRGNGINSFILVLGYTLGVSQSLCKPSN